MPKEKDSISFGIGLLAGVLAGVATGVLYAPKSGEKTRQELKDTVDTIKIKMSPDVSIVSVNMIDRVKYTVEEQINRVNEAIKAGKMATAKAKEEIEAGSDY